METTSYNLGTVTVTRGRTLVAGVPAVNEVHVERKGRVRNMWYLDPNVTHRLPTRAQKRLKRVCATEAELRELALEVKALRK